MGVEGVKDASSPSVAVTLWPQSMAAKEMAKNSANRWEEVSMAERVK